MKFKKGDHVKVSPSATGLGEWIEGFIDDIEELSGGLKLISVTYNQPDYNRYRGIVLSNVRLIEKI